VCIHPRCSLIMHHQRCYSTQCTGRKVCFLVFNKDVNVNTSASAAGIEVVEAGLATHYVPSQKLTQLEDTLHSLGPSARDSGSIGRAIASVQVCSQLEDFSVTGLPSATSSSQSENE